MAQRYGTGSDLQHEGTSITPSHRFDPYFGKCTGGTSRKRILTLDGGGVRGALTLGFLERIEEILQDKWIAKGCQREEFRLWHYFDLIVGTSTGAIIAALLAAGLKASEIKELYFDLAAKIFVRRHWYSSDLISLLSREGVFKAENLRMQLSDKFSKISGWSDGNRSLEGAPLKTGLGIIVRCIDTNHTWFVHNNQTAKFYEENKTTPLTQWIRASTAAPPFFEPERIQLNGGDRILVDGGVSAFNNPALATLMLSTLQLNSTSQPHIRRGFGWPLGENNLLLVSVGTGWHSSQPNTHDLALSQMYKLLKGPALDAFSGDANFLSQAILLWMSNSATELPVHGSAEDLSGELLCNPLRLTYLRYDAALHDPDNYPIHILPGYAAAAKTDWVAHISPTYKDFTNSRNVQALYEIGKHCASRYNYKQRVLASHFPDVFDPTFW